MKTLGGKGGFGMTKGWFLRGSSIFCSQVESQVNKVRWRKRLRDITEAENQGQAVHSLSDINPIIVFLLWLTGHTVDFLGCFGAWSPAGVHGTVPLNLA